MFIKLHTTTLVHKSYGEEGSKFFPHTIRRKEKKGSFDEQINHGKIVCQEKQKFPREKKG